METAVNDDTDMSRTVVLDDAGTWTTAVHEADDRWRTAVHSKSPHCKLHHDPCTVCGSSRRRMVNMYTVLGVGMRCTVK